jgi:hypothetical protein
MTFVAATLTSLAQPTQFEQIDLLGSLSSITASLRFDGSLNVDLTDFRPIVSLTLVFSTLVTAYTDHLCKKKLTEQLTVMRSPTLASNCQSNE